MDIREFPHSTGSAIEDGRLPGPMSPGENGIFGTVVVDGLGRIVSCGDAAELMFGERAARMRGRDVAEFVGGLCLGGTSARYRAGYLNYLCANPQWRHYEVRAGDGRTFVAAFKLSPIVAEGQRLYLLTMSGIGKGGPKVRSIASIGSDG